MNLLIYSELLIYFDELGQGFTLDDPLEEVDLCDGSIMQPTFINQSLEANYKVKLIALLKEYVDCLLGIILRFLA